MAPLHSMTGTTRFSVPPNVEDSCSSSSTQELLYSLYCFLFVIKSLILSRIYLGYFESQFFNMLNTLLDMNW